MNDPDVIISLINQHNDKQYSKVEMVEQRRGRKSSEVCTRDIVNDRANLHLMFIIIR